MFTSKIRLTEFVVDSTGLSLDDLPVRYDVGSQIYTWTELLSVIFRKPVRLIVLSLRSTRLRVIVSVVSPQRAPTRLPLGSKVIVPNAMHGPSHQSDRRWLYIVEPLLRNT